MGYALLYSFFRQNNFSCVYVVIVLRILFLMMMDKTLSDPQSVHGLPQWPAQMNGPRLKCTTPENNIPN